MAYGSKSARKLLDGVGELIHITLVGVRLSHSYNVGTGCSLLADTLDNVAGISNGKGADSSPVF